MQCPACATENPDGNRFCGSCGSALAAPAVERRKLVTSVFCDMSGSTAMGELADAETVFELMRSYFDEARSALERHGGAVEKFIGDAVVGMFGVPEAHEDDALRACRAALEIQERVSTLRAGIAVRIGVNTGEVVAGDAARREMFASGDAVVLGDSVNVAARLEQAAAPGEVLIGDTTYRLLRDAVEVEAVDPITAKGKSEPLTAYRLLGASAQGLVPPRTGTRLVGRLDELALLGAELEATLADRHCRLATVVGEAGVGKSRLALELVGSVGDRARVVRGGCLSYGEGITYWPIAQIVRDLAGIRDDDTAEEARDKVPPRIAQLLGLAEGSMTFEQTLDAVAELLGGAAAERPLLALVDDIHWAEPALLELLERLPRLVGDAPLLVLCLARPELREHRPDWPATIDLEPLATSEIDALLESLDAPASARVRIAHTAAGNPLYTEELVAWAHEGGDFDALPTSLNALLGARLDQLDPGARDALERGAVEGELFHQGTVVELTDEPARAAVPGRLDGLTRKDMIRLGAATFAGEAVAYHFKHILVRDAAYRATTKKLRATLHEHFGDWLERRAGGRVGEYHEIIGYHFEQAYRYRLELGEADAALAGRAGHHLGAAGVHATDRADVRAAANLLGRATALLPPDSLERLELMRHETYAVDQTGRMLEARAISQELYERASALGERRLAAHGKSYATPHPFFDNEADPAAAKAAFEELVETFTELGDEAGLAAAMRRLARVYRTQGQSGLSVEWLEKALVHALASNDMATRRAVTYSLSNDLPSSPMTVAQGIARCEKLLESCGDDRVLEAAVSRQLALLYAMAGRFEEAREIERWAGPLLEEAGVESLSWGSLGAAAATKALMGDRTGAEEAHKTKWLAYPVEEGRTQRLAIGANHALAHLYMDQGRWDEAEECAARYRDPKGGSGGWVEARLAAHRGEHERALELAHRLVEREQQSDSLNGQATAWQRLAEIQRAAGRNDEADSSIATALALYERKGNIAAAALVRAAVTA